MKTGLAFVFLFAASVLAQTSPFTGVWKADVEKSKFMGPPPKSYLVILDQQGMKLTTTVGSVGMHGEERSSFTYDLSGQPSMNTSRGLPMRTVAASDGKTLKLTSETAGRPANIVETYSLSADGNTLTIDTKVTSNSKDMQQTLVLERQPESAGAELRKPEEVASAHFKNVLILKDVPASQFIDIMRYFTVALGADCEFCHVQGNFAADDKHHKVMARQMLTMTHGINEQFFGGKSEVKCYTCHKGQHEPQSQPAFASQQ